MSTVSFEPRQLLFNRAREFRLTVLCREPLCLGRPLDPLGHVAGPDVRHAERKEILRRLRITRLGNAREFDNGLSRTAERHERAADVEASEAKSRLALGRKPVLV